MPTLLPGIFRSEAGDGSGRNGLSFHGILPTTCPPMDGDRAASMDCESKSDGSDSGRAENSIV